MITSKLRYKFKPKTAVSLLPFRLLPVQSNKSQLLPETIVIKTLKRRPTAKMLSKQANSTLSPGIKPSERSQFSWVIFSLILGFTVTHEMTLSVKAVENIGYLVDKILTKPGITLENF